MKTDWNEPKNPSWFSQVWEACIAKLRNTPDIGYQLLALAFFTLVFCYMVSIRVEGWFGLTGIGWIYCLGFVINLAFCIVLLFDQNKSSNSSQAFTTAT